MTTISERVMEILDTTSLSDPREISEKVLGDMSGRELRPALAEVLPEYVRYIERVHRSASGGPEGQLTDALHESFAEGSPRQAPGSSKWRALAGRYAGASERKPLRDCTREDVLAIVARHRSLAESNTSKAEQFERIYRLMVDHDAEVVGDLPEAEVEGVLR